MNTAEDIVNDKNQQILTVSFDDTVHAVCEFMVQNKIGAVLVEKDQEHVGVWAERDLLSNITKEGFDPKTAKVGNYMISPLLTAPHNTPNYKLEEMFLGLFVRHLVVEKRATISVLYQSVMCSEPACLKRIVNLKRSTPWLAGIIMRIGNGAAKRKNDYPPKSSKAIISGSTPKLSSIVSTAASIRGGPQR